MLYLRNQLDLLNNVEARVRVFNEEALDVPLVVFDEALEHMLRIDRVLKQRNACVCMVGRSLRVLPEEADAAAKAWLADGGQKRGPKPVRAKVGGKA